jgi:hypothetical protein
VITKSIERYKPKYHGIKQWAGSLLPTPLSVKQVTEGINNPDSNDRPLNPPRYQDHIHRLSKLEYGFFLRDLKIKKGDIVASKYTQKPYNKFVVFKVVEIDEVHLFVEFGPSTVGPICLNLTSINGSHAFKGGASIYEKVEEADYPEEWKIAEGGV